VKFLARFFHSDRQLLGFLRHDVHAIHTAMGVHCRNAMQGVSNFFNQMHAMPAVMLHYVMALPQTAQTI